MAINYAEKYSPIVAEAFKLQSKTADFVNGKYDFIGVKTVAVYQGHTVALGDYTIAGSDRFGTLSELELPKQEMTLTQDKAFTFVIDRMNYEGTNFANEVGARLKDEIDQVIIPELDSYRIKAMAGATGISAGTATAPTKENAYSLFLDASAALDENKVPSVGRVAFVTPAYLKLLKQDSAFVLQSDRTQEMLVKGIMGEVDGVQVRMLPASYFPVDTYLVMCHKDAVVAPVKLTTYRVLTDVQGIDGAVAEGRIVHDCFVLSNRAKAIYVQKSK